MRIGESEYKVTVRYPNGATQEVTIIATNGGLAQQLAEAQYGKANIVRVLKA